VKIIEAMKRLKVILKRIQDNTQQIGVYSSILSTEKPAFESETEQKKKVSGLVQANTDLMEEYLRLKRAIEATNLKVTVEIAGRSWVISDLLVIKRVLAQPMVNTYNAMSTASADQRAMQGFGKTAEGAMPQAIRMYDETARLKGISEWQEIYSAIDARLEVVNATTDLVS
jgi:hypothetical protein